MNLYFRVLKLLLSRLFFRKPLGFLGTSVVKGRVWPTDLDLNIHVNNGRYLTLMDLGRFDILLRTPLGRACLKHRWFPILGAVKVRFQKPLKPFQAFEIHSRILAWDPKWVYIEQNFVVAGEIYSHAVIQGLLHGPEGKVRTRELLEVAGWKKPSPRLPKEIKDWLRPSS